MEKQKRYLKQVIVARKDLSMPAGKLAAMVAHASMTFLIAHLRGGGLAHPSIDGNWLDGGFRTIDFSEEEARWLTELDPGLEDIGQVSMAKIVCSCADEAELLAIERAAKDAGLEVHRVVDSGYSHNKFGTLACIAIGPDWPERLEPATAKLKVYR
jgi:peptidyl-tRNA hydrolase